MLKTGSDFFRSKIPKKIKKNKFKKRNLQEKIKRMKKIKMDALDSDTVIVTKGNVKTKKKKAKNPSQVNDKEASHEIDTKLMAEKSKSKKKKRSKDSDSTNDVESANIKKKKSSLNINTAEKENEVSKSKELKKKNKKRKQKQKLNKEKTIQSESLKIVKDQDANNASAADVATKEDMGKADKINKKIQTNLNKKYEEAKLKTALTRSWSNTGYPLKIENTVDMVKKPFTCGHILDLFNEDNILEGVKKEVEELELIQKNNDLYKFKQTTDLKNISTPHISALKNFLYGPFRKYMMNITGIELDKTVDIGSSLYEQTDTLLCHDDELEGRRIAFMLYLVPSWEEKDGGTLDLFNIDTNGQPADIVKSFCPVWNSFAFFEVSPVSFHQVSEVLSNKKRLSINGWYHGAPVSRPPKYIDPPRPTKTPCHIEQEDLYSWINHSYLDPWTQKEIKKKFQEDSEIELEQFLAEDKYDALLEAIKAEDLRWQYEGPANQRHYEVVRANKAGELARDCLKFLRSEAVFLIISQLTGLKMHKLAPPDSETEEEESTEKEPNPRVGQEIRRWSHGSFTLLHDDDPAGNQYSLDAMLFLGASEKLTQTHGGFTKYIAKDEDEELLTVLPKSNSLCLVYRDKETLKFTKHINASVKDLPEEEQEFYEVNCTYYE